MVRYEETDPRRRLIYAFYLSDDNIKNKEVNDMILDFWYTRNRLVRSYPLNEIREWFEYKRLWIYINADHEDNLKKEREKRKHIRQWAFNFIRQNKRCIEPHNSQKSKD